MNEYREYLSGVISNEWGSSAYQWFFYLGILAVLLLAKRREVRIALGWVPLLFLAVIYNPLFARLLDHFVSASNSAYLSRFFTFIPLLYVISCGAVLLLSRLKEGAKFLCVCLVGAAMVFSGSSMYRQGWMHPAENPEKAPAEAVETVRILEGLPKEDLCVAAPQGIAVYLRQLDAGLTAPYTRYLNKLGRALAEEEPDPVQVMTLAGEQSVDVVMVKERETTREDFARAGWEPFAETSSCLLYQVTGVPRVLRTLNAERRVASRTALDAEGNPAVGADGYITVRYEYDGEGKVVLEAYYDAQGRPVKLEGKKYASIEYIRDGELPTLLRYYDEAGNLVREKRRKK